MNRIGRYKQKMQIKIQIKDVDTSELFKKTDLDTRNIAVENKILSITVSVTTTALNTKAIEIE